MSSNFLSSLFSASTTSSASTWFKTVTIFYGIGDWKVTISPFSTIRVVVRLAQSITPQYLVNPSIPRMTSRSLDSRWIRLARNCDHWISIIIEG